MRHSLVFLSLVVFCGLLILGSIIGDAIAQQSRVAVRGSGAEIPRFMSLKSDEANMRIGPSFEHRIRYRYQRRGYPVKVIAEFEYWRKIIDHEGNTGWMHLSILSGKRMAMIRNNRSGLHRQANASSPLVAYAESGAILQLDSCSQGWCRVSTPELRGWISRDLIWGLKEGERLD